MKKFSRILVVLAVLSMAIGLMTGCGNKKSEKSDNQSSVEQIKKNGKIKTERIRDTMLYVPTVSQKICLEMKTRWNLCW